MDNQPTTRLFQKQFSLPVSGGCLLLHDQILGFSFSFFFFFFSLIFSNTGPLSSILKKVSNGVLHLSVLVCCSRTLFCMGADFFS